MFLAKLLLNPTTVSRSDWGARDPARPVLPQKKEVTHLVVSFTETDVCENQKQCSRQVRRIQNDHVAVLNKEDIQYNFLIGGDGCIYEGRGWNKAPTYPTNKKEFLQLQGDAFEVAFIGKSDKKPSLTAMKAFAGLMLKAITQKAIVGDFKKVKPCVITADGVSFFKGKIDEEEIKKKSVTDLFADYKQLQ